ncbi:hypothetical protein [Methylobacter sp. YRD-M1]|uniref:hypothetical protein n=1 Tax=Methylobacter sp. YRD-M1 TaxID=2911520 RepID=UPI00227C425B|nr:hypothetical protein [Methylobacter sp. YRD-M1]WAK04399.1 hypothetical protein LZ558_22300 [Methylobacter sp. YRD-M1]
MWREVDEIDEEELQAISDFYESMVSDPRPEQQAITIAQEQFGVSIDDHVLLNRILERYACSLLTIEECVIACLEQSGFMRLAS